VLADFPGTYTPRRTFPGETGAFKVSAKSTRGFIAGQNSFLRPERNSVPLGSGEEVVAFPAEGRSSANRFEIYFMRAIRGWAGRRPRAHPAGDISVDTQCDDKGREVEGVQLQARPGAKFFVMDELEPWIFEF